MLTSAPWHYYVMLILYIVAGLNHFRTPETYLQVMPPYLPAPKFLVLLTGALEVLAGIGLLFKATQSLSIYAIIALLLAFFTVHIYMFSSKEAAMGLSQSLLVLRFLLQFGLIYWAYFYLK